MRALALLAAVPFVFGCAQQSVLRTSALPSDEQLVVRLHQPIAGALHYSLSEPAYVAVFAVTRGHGISMVFPHYQSQIEYRSHAGLNQETVHGGSGAWGYSANSRNEHRSLFGFADAYYVIASKYPLPLEGLVQSPWMLRSLVGADLFRASNLTDTWAALEALLVEGLPSDAWAADVYLNWRDPFVSLAVRSDPLFAYCGDRRSFYGASMLSSDQCGVNRTTVSNPATPAPVPVLPVAEGTKRRPPAEPLDKNPLTPLDPPRISRVSEVARISRVPSQSEALSRRESEPRRSEPSRSEPSRPAEARPQQDPPRAESKRPDPPPDPA